jgi:GH24 family phage-related lysozyme (muramidase)
LAQLKLFEGCIPWMYRDTAGHVTVGVGLMLPDSSSACALPFTSPSGPSTPRQIAAEFARVSALPPAKLPAFYKSPTSPELPQPVIDAKLSAVLEAFEAALRAKLPAYDALPDSVKIALLDMAYNLGPEGLLKGYPLMLRAIESSSWAQAAAECERHGVSAARNAWTSQQLLSAAIATIKAEAESLERTSTTWLARLGRWIRTLLRPSR